jgi:transcription initiation factor TFIIB
MRWARPPDDHETVCTDCELVIDEEQIDHGPEWRDFDTDPGTSERAAPVTPTTRQDKVLGTTISHIRDGTGRQLSGKKRRHLSRLRTWHSRARVGSKQDRNQINGLTDNKRITNALRLPEHVMKQDCVLFKTGQDNDLLLGRSIEGFFTAALYAAARLNKTPQSIGNFANVSKVDHNRVTDSYSVLNRELALPIPPSLPIEYLPQLVSTIDVPPRVEQEAADLLEDLEADRLCQGRKPVGVAAAAIYHTARDEPGLHLTQTQLALQKQSVTKQSLYRLEAILWHGSISCASFIRFSRWKLCQHYLDGKHIGRSNG